MLLHSLARAASARATSSSTAHEDVCDDWAIEQTHAAAAQQDTITGTLRSILRLPPRFSLEMSVGGKRRRACLAC